VRRASLFRDLAAFENEWQSRAASVLKSKFEMSPAYFAVMAGLDRLGCCEPNELATALHIREECALAQLSTGGVRGDCREVRHVTPGARRHVALTSQGHNVTVRADNTLNREMETLFGGLSLTTLRGCMVAVRRLRNPEIQLLA
jgi:hypothetical protein